MIRISAVICTYNRANSLWQAVGSLIHQSLKKELYEIIIVNNGCTDNTSEVVGEIKASHPKCNIVPIYEDQLGAGRARNKGVRNARGEVVAFLDDDARGSPVWLETALRCFDEVKPTPMGIGGPILPLYSSSKPAWFKDEYEIRSWGREPRFLKYGETFSGSNMIFWRRILEKFGGFDTVVEIKGKSLILGEECVLYEKMWQSMGSACLLYYSPELEVWHAVPNYKINVSYRLKRAFAMGQSWGIRQKGKSVGWKFWLVRKTFVSIFRSGTWALLQGKKGRDYLHNWIIEILFPILIDIGRLMGSMGIIISLRHRPQ